jgi:CheY-like chemotaxis protein
MTREEASPVTIALADDNADLRRSLEILLEHLGYRVVCAVDNGRQLLDLCFGEDVDVVLVDLDMPEMDGLAAAEEIAARGVPVILLSGHPDADEVVLEHEPIVARVTKPATVVALQEAIEQALAFKKLRHPR